MRSPISSDALRRLIPGKRTAYRMTFDGPRAKEVLEDLASFCRAHSAPFVAGDPMATGVLIGRQEVFHRISRYLHLSDEEIIRLMLEGNQRS